MRVTTISVEKESIGSYLCYRHISVALARYLRWYVASRALYILSCVKFCQLMKHSRLGVKTRVFHLGDYRRESVGQGQEMPDDYFFVNGRFSFLYADGSLHLMVIEIFGSICKLRTPPPENPQKVPRRYLSLLKS